MKRVVTATLLALILGTLLVSLVGAAPPVQDSGQEYIVQADDWLSKLADKNYGDVFAWPAIWQATNTMAESDDSFANIPDPNLIEVGQKLWIPAEAEAAVLLEQFVADSASTLPDLGGREITIAIENAYLPFNYISLTTGEPAGWDYDALEAICGLLNCTPVFVEAAWDGMIQAVADGQYDMAADGITITADRAEIVDFSTGYINIEQRLLVRLDEERFSSADELAADTSLTIGSQPGTTNYETAVQLVGEDRIDAYETFPFAVQALIAGDVDAVLMDETAGQGYVGVNGDQLKLVGDSLSSDQLGFIFTKGSDLVEPVNAALATLQANGTLNELAAKYFTEQFTVTYDDIGDGAYGSD